MVWASRIGQNEPKLYQNWGSSVIYHSEMLPTQLQIHPIIQLNQNMRTPSHHGHSEMVRLGQKHFYTWKHRCHDRKEPHAIPCMPNLARKIHMQVDTCNEAYCSCLILPFPAWSLLPLTFFAFLDPMHNHSKILSQEITLCQSLPTDPHKPFYERGLYFLHFPLFSFIFLLTCNLWPFTFFFS